MRKEQGSSYRGELQRNLERLEVIKQWPVNRTAGARMLHGATDHHVRRVCAAKNGRAARRMLLDQGAEVQVANEVFAAAEAYLDEAAAPCSVDLAKVIDRKANSSTQRYVRRGRKRVRSKDPDKDLVSEAMDTKPTELEALIKNEQAKASAMELVRAVGTALVELRRTNPRYFPELRACLMPGDGDPVDPRPRAMAAYREALISVCTRRLRALPESSPHAELYTSLMENCFVKQKGKPAFSGFMQALRRYLRGEAEE